MFRTQDSTLQKKVLDKAKHQTKLYVIFRCDQNTKNEKAHIGPTLRCVAIVWFIKGRKPIKNDFKSNSVRSAVAPQMTAVIFPADVRESIALPQARQERKRWSYVQ